MDDAERARRPLWTSRPSLPRAPATRGRHALQVVVPEPKVLVVIPGSDHFFTGEIEAVETAVSDWAPRAIAS